MKQRAQNRQFLERVRPGGDDDALARVRRRARALCHLERLAQAEVRTRHAERRLCLQGSELRQLRDVVDFPNRKIFYSWIGGTRMEWRGQGRYRALTEQQEEWAHAHGYHELVVKTKNRFYDMRGTLDHLRFEVVKYERNPGDNAESKVYLSKKLLPETITTHRSARTVVQISS